MSNMERIALLFVVMIFLFALISVFSRDLKKNLVAHNGIRKLSILIGYTIINRRLKFGITWRIYTIRLF